MAQEPDSERANDAVVALAKSQSVLYGYIYLHLGDPDATEDLLQETNRSIWKNLAHLDSPANFLPWAKTLAAFEIKRYRTNLQRERKKILFDGETVDRLAEELAAPDAREAEGRDIAFDALEKCIGRLPAKLRNLIDRRYWHREPVEQIAREDSSNRSAVTVRLVRVRRSLGDCVRKLLCSLGEEVPPSRAERERSALLEDAGFRRDWFDLGSIHAALAYNADKIHLLMAKAPDSEPRSSRWRARLLRTAAALALLAGFAVAGTALKRAAPAAPQTLPAPTAPVNRIIVRETLPEIPPAALPAIKKGQTNMQHTLAAAAVTAAAVALTNAPSAPAACETFADGSALSAAVAVNANPDATAFWRTANLAGTRELYLDWPSSAVSARLTLTSMTGDKSVAFTKAEYPSAYAFPASPTAMGDERVYVLKLEYLDSSGSTVATETAGGIGFVTGTGVTAGSTRYIAEEPANGDKRWHEFFENTVVLPVPADVETLSIDKATVDSGTGGLPGWFGWGPIAIGEHTVGTNALNVVTLVRHAGGTLYIVH